MNPLDAPERGEGGVQHPQRRVRGHQLQPRPGAHRGLARQQVPAVKLRHVELHAGLHAHRAALHPPGRALLLVPAHLPLPGLDVTPRREHEPLELREAGQNPRLDQVPETARLILEGV